MQINVGTPKRWYDKEPRVSDAFARLLILPAEHRNLFSDVINQCSIHLKKQSQNHGGLTSLGGDRIIGLLKAQKRRRPEDQDKYFHKAMTNLYILEDIQRDFMAERVYISINCYDEYIHVCKRMEKAQDIKEMGNLVSITIGKGLRAGEKYMITIGKYDDQTQIALSRLTILYKEPVEQRQSEDETAAESVPSKQSAEVAVAEAQQPKERARLKSSDQGMKIHSQDVMKS